MLPFILFVLALQSAGQPINIPIQNPSFEQPTRTSGPDRSCGFGGFEVPGWTGPVFAYRLADGDPCGIASPFPDGQYAADLMNGMMSQDLGIMPADGVYVMKFWVANYFYWYSPTYHAALAVGDKPPSPTYVPIPIEFCSTSGWGQGDWAEIPLACPAQRAAAILNATGNLYIVFASEGPDGNYWPVLIDKVSLTFTPSN